MATLYQGLRAHVRSYDSPVGMGVVELDSVDLPLIQTLDFHCTQIADGTREIEVGVAVLIDVMATGPGCWEAGRVTILN